MKTGRSLKQLAVELERQAAAKRDYVVSSVRMGMNETGSRFRLFRENGASVSFTMSPLFERQLGAALGIPTTYYDKMRDEYPELLAQNVNGWLGRSDAKHTVRTLDNTVRAFLSDKYRRIDNIEIAEAVLPIIGQMPDVRVESCDITDSHMYIKVVNPRLETEVRKGDIVQSGVVISNSEVGLGSVTVMPLVYRLVCLNCMIVYDLGQRKYHTGRQLEESWELFSDETMRADDRAFFMKLCDIVRTAVDEARFAKAVEKLRESAGAKITGDVPALVELAAKSYGFNQNEQSGVLRHLIEGGDLSLYGLSNAVTRASQDTDSYDRATALETAGWQIVTMAPQLWQALNNKV
jgi:hypothetical protein